MAPGRVGKSRAGIVKKVEVEVISLLDTDEDVSINRIEPWTVANKRANKISGVTESRINDVTAPGAVKMRAKGKDKRKLQTSKENESTTKNFRAPARERQTGEAVAGYQCGECQRFSELLKREKVDTRVLSEMSRHKYFCAPTASPPNLWEPWEFSPTILMD